MLVVEVEEAQRLDTAVVAAIEGTSRAVAARWIREGRVRVDQRVVDKPGQQVPNGAWLEIEIPDTLPSAAVAQDLPLVIVYEDADLAVIDKAAGMMVHPAPGHPDGTLVNALLHHFDGLSTIGGVERPGLVHRLDIGTSGLLVVAKNDATHRSLAAQFAEHTAGRIYLAWVHDPPQQERGTSESWLARDPRHRQRFVSTTPEHGRRAVTHWEVLAREGAVGLVRCRLETGRTHQIRVHLSELGSPLLGDPHYALMPTSVRPPTPLPRALVPVVTRPMLHAWRLRFQHPGTGAQAEFEADPPEDFQTVREILGVNEPARLI